MRENFIEYSAIEQNKLETPCADALPAQSSPLWKLSLARLTFVTCLVSFEEWF